MDEENSLPKLRPGTTVEVLTQDNLLTFLGKVKGSGGDMMLLEGAQGEALPPVLYNTPIKIRAYLAGSGTVVFDGQVCGSTVWEWKVDRLRCLQQEERRNFFRQRISLPGKLRLANKIFKPGAGGSRSAEVVDCRVLDISVGGALVSCRERFQPGDWLLLTQVELIRKEPLFDFTCHVQRELQGDRPYLFRYGCQFVGMTPKEQDKLHRTILQLQRQDIQSRRSGNWELPD